MRLPLFNFPQETHRPLLSERLWVWESDTLLTQRAAQLNRVSTSHYFHVFCFYYLSCGGSDQWQMFWIVFFTLLINFLTQDNIFTLLNEWVWICNIIIDGLQLIIINLSIKLWFIIIMSCHVIIRNRLSLSKGSRGVAAGANPSLVSGRGQGAPWTSRQLIAGPHWWAMWGSVSCSRTHAAQPCLEPGFEPATFRSLVYLLYLLSYCSCTLLSSRTNIEVTSLYNNDKTWYKIL